MAKGKGHKHQHFIPACYLKAWVDPARLPNEHPYIWIFAADGSTSRRKAPENVFRETDMYTVQMPEGSRNLSLEHGLGSLETMFSRLRKAKIDFARELAQQERSALCLFVAAMQTRTPANREHQREQWSRTLNIMEDMKEHLEKASPEERKRFAAIQPRGTGADKGFTHEQVKQMVENPLQTMMVPMINALAPLLSAVDLALLKADDDLGFITSDSPVVWFDEESYKRPPLWRTPGLGSKTIEISFPISPTCCAVFNRQGMKGYIDVTAEVVDQINRRTRFQADECFVTRKNEKREIWFDPGTEPSDSWENLHPDRDALGSAIEVSEGVFSNDKSPQPPTD